MNTSEHSLLLEFDRCRTGVERACEILFEQLIQHATRVLMRKADRQIRSHVPDLAQTVLFRFQQKMTSEGLVFEHAGDIKAYVATCCFNALRDWFRAEGRRPKLSPLPKDFDTPFTFHSNRTIDLETLLNALTSDDRRIVELKYFESLSYDEIATDIGISHQDVKSALDRIRKQLSWTAPLFAW